MKEEEVKGPSELISSNPKSIGSSDDSDQVKNIFFFFFCLPILHNLTKYLFLGG